MKGINWKTVAASVAVVFALNNISYTRDYMQGKTGWF